VSNVHDPTSDPGASQQPRPQQPPYPQSWTGSDPHMTWAGPEPRMTPAGPEPRMTPAGQPPWMTPPGSAPWPPPQPRGRRRGLVIASVGLAVAAFAGAGTAWAVRTTTPSVLTASQVAAKVDPGLVDVISTLGDQGGVSEGTGLVLTSSGEVLTNNHVIAGATSIKVVDVGGGRTFRAVVVGYDESHDIAVLRMVGASGLATAPLGDSSTVVAGQRVVALGNAGGKGGTPAVATGKIIALNQAITASDQEAGTSEQLTGLIHSNAGIQPGDSGGPLVSTAGLVIGLDTAAGTSPSGVEGMSSTTTQAFSIPINEARAIANQIETGHVSATAHLGATAFLGVAVQSAATAVPGTSGTGAYVAGVESGSPASQAGLTAGDVIVSLGGRQIAAPSGIRAALVASHPGDKISVSWTDQAGQTHTATVVLVAGPAG
jgi:S1-C subfamily serine protease